MRGLTEEAAAVAIDVATRVLHLPTVRTSADELAAAAVRDRLTHRAYLAELLAAEVDDREARRRERRIAEARFPRTKRLAEFDLGATPSIQPAVLAALATSAWITAGEPVVLLGDSGLDELVDERCRGHVADPEPSLAGGDPEPNQQVGLAGTALPGADRAGRASIDRGRQQRAVQ